MPETEVLMSRTDAAAVGLRPRKDAQAARYQQWRHGEYPLYRREDLEEKPPARKIAPPRTVDLLAAIFGVNRAAKRYRDAAASCYESAAHQFAGANKRKKQGLYRLKDNGIMEAMRCGRIAPVGTHGPLTVYRGEGYCFHSLLRPAGTVLRELSPDLITVESKPRGKSEERLMDAEYTLEALKKDERGWVRNAFPGRDRERYRVDSEDDGEDDWRDDEEDNWQE